MTQYISQEGFNKLKKELEEREGSIRAEINARVMAAKEMGDLKENAEFSDAMDAKSFNEGRIEELKQILKEVEIVDVDQKIKGVVAIGSTVGLKTSKGAFTFTIVSPAEANPAKGFISYESPVGQALVGHKKGDEVNVKTPSGMMNYSITSVE